MFHQHGRMAVFTTLFFFTLANLHCGGGGGGGGGDGDDTTLDTSDPTAAYPSDLAAASSSIFSASSSVSEAISRVRSRQTGIPTDAATETQINFQEKKADMEELLNGNDVASCMAIAHKVNLQGSSKNVSCYGPTLTFVKNGQSSSLPSGDLGIWDETENGEACAAAKLNADFANFGAVIDVVLGSQAALLCVANVKDIPLPDTGKTLEMTTILDEAIAEGEEQSGADIPIDPINVTIAQLEPTADGFQVFEFNHEVTISFSDGGEMPESQLGRQAMGSACTSTNQCTSPLQCISGFCAPGSPGTTTGGTTTGGTTGTTGTTGGTTGGGTMCTSTAASTACPSGQTCCPSGQSCVTQNSQGPSASNPGGCTTQSGGSTTGTTTGGTPTMCTSSTSCPSGQTCKTQNGQPASASNPGGCVSEQSGGSSTGTTTGGTTGEPPPGWGEDEGGGTGPGSPFSQAALDIDGQLQMIHIPMDGDNSTYKGRIAFRLVSPSAGGFNCGTSESNTQVMTINYHKSSSSVLNMEVRQATFCGDVALADTLDSSGQVDFSLKYNVSGSMCSGETETTEIGWGDDANQYFINMNPETGFGAMTYAWQAGRCDQNTRCFEAEITPTGGSDSGPGGCAYFGYGPDIEDLEGTSCLDGIICAWTGPESETFGNKTIIAKVQRQCMTLNETDGIYTSDAATLNIAYTPALDCDSTGATYTCDGSACPGDPTDDLQSFDATSGSGISVTAPDPLSL